MLTERIYQEAIEKAEAEAKEIIETAKNKSRQIINEAKEEAEQIILAKARKEAELLRTSTESELQLSGKRLISDMKREITNMISDKILTQNIKGVFLNETFFKEILLEIIKHWGKEDIIQLHLPKSFRDKVDKGFDQAIAAHVKDLRITFEEKISGGFRISKEDDSYQISFTDDDFIAFFHTYLNNKTRQILFGAS